MRAYKIENGAVPVPARVTGVGTYRVNQGQEAAWPPADRAYGGAVESPWRLALEMGGIALRLLVPLLLLLTLMLAVYLYADAELGARLPRFAQGVTITIADLVLPGCWTIIHLTNRRYGPHHAFGHLAAGLVAAVLIALANPGDIANWLPSLPSLTWRAVIAFFVSFAVANVAAITAFDLARGPRWWSAPLVGSAIAAFFFAGLYYPLAFGGAPLSGLVHFLLWLAVGVVLLLPYCLLRPAMRPLNGMNGF